MICNAIGFFYLAFQVKPNPGRAAHRFNLYNTSRWCRRGLRILGIRLKVYGRPGSTNHALQICNHLSYVDAIVIAAIRPSLFITSQEVAEDPVLGRFSRAGGCDFVERRNVRGLPVECQRLGRHLQHASLMLFPEATSADGFTMLPFKPAFFSLAQTIGAPLQPLCLTYPMIAGQAFSRANHRRVCWFDDMPFLPHALQLLVIPSTHAEIRYLPMIEPNQFPDRKNLARHAHWVINTAYTTALSPDLGRQHPQGPGLSRRERPAC